MKKTKPKDSQENNSKKKLLKSYPTHKAKAELSKLIRLALEGNEVIISKGYTPLVKLVPIEDKKQPRKLGIEEGEFFMSKDFNAPINDFKEYS